MSNIYLGGRFFLGMDYAGATVRFYEVGTTTPLSVCADKNLSVSLGSVITLDSHGSAVIFLPRDAKVVVTLKGAAIYTQDGGIVSSDTSSSNDNRVTNGSAEDNSDSDGVPDNWTVTTETGSTNTRVSTDQICGTYCFRSDDAGNGGGTWLHTPYIECSENEEFAWDVEFKASHVDVRIVFDILWYDANKNQLTGGSAKTTAYDDSATNPSAWTRYYGVVTPPAGATFCRPQIALCHSSAGANGKWAQFDGLNIGRPSAAHHLTTTGDILYADAANSPARFAIGAEGRELRAVGGLPVWSKAVPGYVFVDLGISNGTDADHDLNIEAGRCWDKNLEYVLDVGALTKQIDASFVEGANAGGMAPTVTKTGTFTTVGTAVTGAGTAFDTEFQVGDVLWSASKVEGRMITAITNGLYMTIESAFTTDVSVADDVKKNGLAPNCTYHVLLRHKDADGSVDVVFSTRTTPKADDTPAGFSETIYRRRCSIITDASANILPFTQKNNLFIHGSIIADGSWSASAVAYDMTLSIPYGALVIPMIVVRAIHLTAYSYILVYSQYQSEPVPTSALYDLIGDNRNSYVPQVLTDTAIIKMKASGGNASVYVNTYGWVDVGLLEGD